MLFTSPEFLFLFAPAVISLFFITGRHSQRAALFVLLTASFVFYLQWEPRDLLVLGPSVAGNYWLGRRIVSAKTRALGKRWMILGLSADLAALAVFKYGNFIVVNINATGLAEFRSPNIHLPLGISFFTFTQIAYLVDCWRRETTEPDALKYSLFVTYFPHLIAGPILHHKQMVPQFGNSSIFKPSASNLALGMVLFGIGLLKKVIFADSFAEYASPVFDAAVRGEVLSPVTAWVGALGYTLQLYFDFSGYSDMAVGVSLGLGIHLPVNFNSPYKAASIVEFWRRWHISLSTFLRDYLYIPLGGNRAGLGHHANLLITMVLGGLWHGASWTFVLWGTLHGCYLIANHMLRQLLPKQGFLTRLCGWLGYPTTFLLVVIAWVFFRAPDTASATSLLRSMWELTAVSPGGGTPLTLDSILIPQDPKYTVSLFLSGFITVWCLPNSMEIVHAASDWLRRLRFYLLGAGSVLITLIALIGLSHGASEFIYFNF